MYEPAAADMPSPLWQIERGLAFFAGPLGHNAPHRHATPVLLMGLYGAFALRLGGRPWRRSQAAIIPAGRIYEFDMQQAPLAVLYLEPDLAGIAALRPLLAGAEEADGALLGRPAEGGLFRHLYEQGARGAETCEVLFDLAAFGKRRAGAEMDPRIRSLVTRLSEDLTETVSATVLGAEIGLSVSRMQHLFADSIGVPMRRYRMWRRLRAAIELLAGGRSGTEAAHAAGFFDQPHFIRAFRNTFGAAPRLSMPRPLS